MAFFLGKAQPLHHPLDAYDAVPPPYWNPKYATGHHLRVVTVQLYLTRGIFAGCYFTAELLQQ